MNQLLNFLLAWYGILGSSKKQLPIKEAKIYGENAHMTIQ